MLHRWLDGVWFNGTGGFTDVGVHQRLAGGREVRGVFVIAKLTI
jgi:hypothetical protein